MAPFDGEFNAWLGANNAALAAWPLLPLAGEGGAKRWMRVYRDGGALALALTPALSREAVEGAPPTAC